MLPSISHFKIRKENEMDFDEDCSHIWLIYCDNGERKCILGTNWLQQISPADSSNSANLLVISTGNDIYVVSGPTGIPPNTKLKYYAKEDPSTEYWTSCTQAWSNKKNCPRCSSHQKFDNISDYRVHISLWHDVSPQGKDLFDRSHNPSHSTLYPDVLKINTMIDEKQNLAKMPFFYCLQINF